jgi:hypothetical protein
LLKTLEAVPRETPAARATSVNFTILMLGTIQFLVDRVF